MTYYNMTTTTSICQASLPPNAWIVNMPYLTYIVSGAILAGFAFGLLVAWWYLIRKGWEEVK